MRYAQAYTVTVSILLLTTCGSPSQTSVNPVTTDAPGPTTTAQPVDASPTASATAVPSPSARTQTDGQSTTVHSDYDILPSLAERVARASIIVIGQVTATDEIINGARLPEDPTQPDPRVFVLGQVYHVEVQRYLKGTGASTLNVVQVEGFISSEGEPVKIPETAAEIANLKAAYEHVPMRAGTRYLFFLDPLDGFDPALNYMAGGLGLPWRFTLPEGGVAQQESPVPEVSQRFPPLPSAALIGQVEQLSQTPK